MRIKYISGLSVLLIIGVSCKKDFKIKDIDFEASTNKTEFTTTEPVVFNLTGNPDIITFYSGLPGGRYEYKSRVSADGTPILNFSSARNSGAQANSLSLLVSSDFAGVDKDNTKTIANIAAGNWKDLQPKLATGTTVTPTGDIDLSSVAKDNKKVYFAFKYTASKGSIQNKWTINNLSIVNKLPDNTVYTIANLVANNTEIVNYGAITYSPGWVASIVAGKVNWAVSAGTSLIVTGAATAVLATDDAEAWVIMGPIDLKKVSPDLGLPIKKQSENMSAFPYSFTYANAGDYKPTFVGLTSSSDAQNVKVKTLSIKVK